MEVKSVVAVAGCGDYQVEAVRQAVTAVLAPLGGIGRFVRSGMRVLLKPNLLNTAALERAVTTHPMVVQIVAEMVQEAGGEVWIGDSPSGPVQGNPRVWRTSGMADVAERTGASLLLLESVVWKRLNDKDYFLARPLSEADLVINLPKLKTHSLTLYTGAVKNMFGAVPGPRKRQVHYLAPGVPDFSRALVDVLELTRPGLTILDGVLGQEGWGPGLTGTPRRYRLVAASTDPVALDAVVAQALGYRPGDVLHLAQAEARGLGVASRERITVVGDAGALRFGAVRLPVAWWFLQLPAWVAAPLRPATRMQPRLIPSACLGCGSCAAVCPRRAITPGRPPRLDMDRCVGCLCCVEVCPEGAIAPRRSLLARLFAVGG